MARRKVVEAIRLLLLGLNAEISPGGNGKSASLLGCSYGVAGS